MFVGFGSKKITPVVSLTMDGYMDRDSSSTGVLFNLYSKACVIQQDTNVCVMVSVDILGVDHSTVTTIKNYISNQYGIDKQSIFINASHTHAAPQAARFGDMGEFFIKENPTQDDLKYYSFLKKQIIKSIEDAFKNIKECTIEFAQQPIEGVSSNRVVKDGSFNNVASMFLFRNMDDEVNGIWTIYANHPTILDASNTEFSNDFISYYLQELHKHYPKCTCMYLQGCAGDISSRYIKKASSNDEAKRLGVLLAVQVIKSFQKTKQCLETLETAQHDIVFDTKVFDSEVNYQQEIDQAYKRYVSLKEKNMEASMIRSAYVTYQGKKMQQRVKEKLNISSISSFIGKINLGNITIITTPAETFGAIDSEIQNLNKGNTTIVLGYTNGYVGYLVDDSMIDQEDVYENNMMVIHKDSHQKLIEAIRQL